MDAGGSFFVHLQDSGYNGDSEGNTIPIKTTLFIAGEGEK